MKKKLLMLLFVVTFFTTGAVSASAVENGIVKVGLRYGSSALFSANLENAIGEGYEFGWFDEDREFVSIGETEEIAISMTAAGTIYMNSSGTYSPDEPSGQSKVLGEWHIQVEGFEDFWEAQDFAWEYDGYPAYIDGEYVVRMGFFDSKSEAREELEDLDFLEEEPEQESEEEEPAEEEPVEEDTAQDPQVETYSRSHDENLSYTVAKSSSTGILVTVTRTTDVLFEFDCSGIYDFGVLPMEERGEDGTATWFKGYKYPGGFSYPRVTGGSLHVINVVDLEEYVKGVIPYEMSGSWPIEALKAQVKEELYQQLYPELRAVLYKDLHDDLKKEIWDELYVSLSDYINGNFKKEIYELLEGKLSKELYERLYQALYEGLYNALYVPMVEEEEEEFVPLI